MEEEEEERDGKRARMAPPLGGGPRSPVLRPSAVSRRVFHVKPTAFCFGG
jgi:hypothetical protein